MTVPVKVCCIHPRVNMTQVVGSLTTRTKSSDREKSCESTSSSFLLLPFLPWAPEVEDGSADPVVSPVKNSNNSLGQGDRFEPVGSQDS